VIFVSAKRAESTSYSSANNKFSKLVAPKEPAETTSFSGAKTQLVAPFLKLVAPKKGWRQQVFLVQKHNLLLRKR
jgi:hypothetical protein